MKLKTLLEKVNAASFPDDLEAYLEDFVPNVLLKSDTLQQAFEVNDEEMERLYREAYALYERETYQEGVTLFRYLVILNPFIKKYWMGLGACLQLREQYEKALHAYAVATFLEDEDPYPHFHAYECYSKLNEPQEAEKAFTMAWERSAAHPLLRKKMHA